MQKINQPINIIIAITPLVNLYIKELLESLDGDYIIIEYSSKKIIRDRSLNIFSLVYKNKLDHIKKLKRAKFFLDDAKKNSSVTIFFHHALDILSQHALRMHFDCYRIIPDGMFNYAAMCPNTTIKYLDYYKRKLIAFFSGVKYQKLNRDAYGSDLNHIEKIYCLSPRNLVRPTGCEVSQIPVAENSSELNNRILILGQPVAPKNHSKYIRHIDSIISNYHGENLYFRAHPREVLTIDLRSILDKHDVTIDNDFSMPELNERGYKTIVGITSTALMNAKLINENVECHFFPKNLWDFRKEQLNGLVKSLTDIGCINKGNDS